MNVTKAMVLSLLWVLASGCGLVIAPVLQGKAEDRIEQKFEVSPGGELRMDVDRGSIEVRGGDQNEVPVRADRKAQGRRSQVDNWLKRHQVTIQQEGNDVVVKSRFEGSRGWGWFRRSPQLEVRYVVTVPRSYDVGLQTAGGKVSVASLHGHIRAKTAGGGMEFDDIQGPINGQTSGGSISAANCNGQVDIRTSGGGIRLREIGGDITAHTAGGSIHVERVRGGAQVETSGGGIEIKGVRGSVTASTSGGSIQAVIESQPGGDQSLKSSGGSITIYLPATAALDIDAHTSGGGVATELPVTTVVKGDQKRDTLQGTINGGGTRLYARTSGGSIRLKTTAAEAE